MNKTEILEIINLVKRLPNSPFSGKSGDELNTVIGEMTTIFSAVLEDLPVDMVRAATVQYLSEGTPFFPMPGTIRDRAMELQMLALGVPSAAEAWSQVVKARRYEEREYCEVGYAMREAYNSTNGMLVQYIRHEAGCPICGKVGGYVERYDHPAVKEAVELLGGRDVILTDNPVADRARFIEAYREVIARERMKMAMTPKVSEFVQTVKPGQLQSGNSVKQLAERLSK